MSHPVIRSASAYFDLPADKIVSADRAQKYARVRCAIIYVFRHHHEHSLLTIARRMNRDHSSIMHALKIFERKYGEDEEIMTWVKGRFALPKISAAQDTAVLIRNLVRQAEEARAAALAEKEAQEAAMLEDAAQKAAAERIKLSSTDPFTVNKDGFTDGELYVRRGVRSGTMSLLRAIRASHPDRVAA